MEGMTGLATLANYENSSEDSGSSDASDASDAGDASDAEAPQAGVSQTSRVSSRVSCAFRAFQHFDSGAELHGSQVLGLADDASDVDILSSKPVHQLLKALRNQKLPAFELSESVMAARIPRVIVRHRKTGLLLDVVETCRDPDAKAKDVMVNRWLQLGSDVRTFALEIKAFGRACQRQLPREQGYPNTFLLLLTGFWWLSTQQGRRPDDSESSGPTNECSGKESGSELFRGSLMNNVVYVV